MVGVTEVSLQNHRPTVDVYGLLKVHCGFIVLLLLLVDVSESEPGVVVALVGVDCILVIFPSLIEVLILDIFVTT